MKEIATALAIPEPRSVDGIGVNPARQHDVTRFLRDWSDGDPQAVERLMPLVYDELRRLARAYLSRERHDHTLQATALVNEAYLRLVDQTRVTWRNRAHFYGVAAQFMRRILVDYARARAAEKRGSDAPRYTLDEARILPQQQAAELIALEDALESLEQIDPRKSRVVELRFFGGLTHEEAAEVLGVSAKTVRRDWNMAKLWLYRELSNAVPDEAVRR